MLMQKIKNRPTFSAHQRHLQSPVYNPKKVASCVCSAARPLSSSASLDTSNKVGQKTLKNPQKPSRGPFRKTPDYQTCPISAMKSSLSEEELNSYVYQFDFLHEINHQMAAPKEIQKVINKWEHGLRQLRKKHFSQSRDKNENKNDDSNFQSPDILPYTFPTPISDLNHQDPRFASLPRLGTWKYDPNKNQNLEQNNTNTQNKLGLQNGPQGKPSNEILFNSQHTHNKSRRTPEELNHELRQWVLDNGGEIHPHVISKPVNYDLESDKLNLGDSFDDKNDSKNKKDPNYRNWGLFAMEDIPTNTTLAIIPFKMCIQPLSGLNQTHKDEYVQITQIQNGSKNNFEAELQKVLTKIRADPAAEIVRIYLELINYENSSFQPYLNTLPQSFPDILVSENLINNPYEQSNPQNSPQNSPQNIPNDLPLLPTRTENNQLLSPLRFLSTDTRITIENEQDMMLQSFKHTLDLISAHVPETLLNNNILTWEMFKYIKVLLHTRGFNTRVFNLNPVNSNSKTYTFSTLIPFLDLLNNNQNSNTNYFFTKYDQQNNPTHVPNLADVINLSRLPDPSPHSTAMFLATTRDINKGEELCCSYHVGAYPTEFPFHSPLQKSNQNELLNYISPLEQPHSKPQNHSSSPPSSPLTHLQPYNPLSSIPINFTLTDSLARYPYLELGSFIQPSTTAPHFVDFFHYGLIRHSAHLPFRQNVRESTELNGYYHIKPWLFMNHGGERDLGRDFLTKILNSAKQFYISSLKNTFLDEHFEHNFFLNPKYQKSVQILKEKKLWIWDPHHEYVDNQWYNGIQWGLDLSDCESSLPAPQTPTQDISPSSFSAHPPHKHSPPFSQSCPIPFRDDLDNISSDETLKCISEIIYGTVSANRYKIYEDIIATNILMSKELQNAMKEVWGIENGMIDINRGQKKSNLKHNNRNSSLKTVQTVLLSNSHYNQNLNSGLNLDKTTPSSEPITKTAQFFPGTHHNTPAHLNNDHEDPLNLYIRGQIGLNSDNTYDSDELHHALMLLYPFSFSLKHISPALQHMCYLLAHCALTPEYPFQIMDMMKSVLYPDSREGMEWVSSKEGQNYLFFTMQTPEQKICESFGDNYSRRDGNVDKIKIDPFAHLHLPARCVLLAIIEESINVQHPNITFRTQSMLNDIKRDGQDLENDAKKMNKTVGDGDTNDQHKLASELTESIAKRYENVPNYALQHIFNSIATKINVENRYWDLGNIIENRLNLDQIGLNISQNRCENEPNKEVNPQNRGNSGTITPVSHIGWWKTPLSGTY